MIPTVKYQEVKKMMFILFSKTKTTRTEEPKEKYPNSGMTEERESVIALAGAIFYKKMINCGQLLIDKPNIVFRRQSYNIKGRTQTKVQVMPKANFADQVSALEELQHTMPFVKLIFRHYKKVPSVILYTEEHISDIKKRYCPPVTAEYTMLSFDKTFNLSNVHVTNFYNVYKCLAVKRRSTNDHPIFCGPLLLPQAPRLTCTRHLRQNFSHTLADKAGLPKQERQRFITQVFGDNSIIAHGADHMDIADRLQHMAESTENRSVEKLIEIMSPLLVEIAKGLERPRLHFASPLWTNNNCESLNHCLKQALSCRSLKLVELVQKLHSIIKTQHREVQRAICGVGEFVLVDEYQRFGVPKDVCYFYPGKQQ
ncbi:hypothetical protein PoB_004587700 [Plakobranchus ocellatus]|uniref:Uncharacterized protein n=1 Tax=Plakobranchus ocellatus TaxID=259542 RepID=A0AAV4BJ45_9GAST|nr:hypothetical protein PoB_004587700 [Plakobranchus ocellatus]